MSIALLDPASPLAQERHVLKMVFCLPAQQRSEVVCKHLSTSYRPLQFDHYNAERPHQAMDYQTPDEVYAGQKRDAFAFAQAA